MQLSELRAEVIKIRDSAPPGIDWKHGLAKWVAAEFEKTSARLTDDEIEGLLLPQLTDQILVRPLFLCLRFVEVFACHDFFATVVCRLIVHERILCVIFGV